MSGGQNVDAAVKRGRIAIISVMTHECGSYHLAPSPRFNA
jgi:hypothetical protein